MSGGWEKLRERAEWVKKHSADGEVEMRVRAADVLTLLHEMRTLTLRLESVRTRAAAAFADLDTTRFEHGLETLRADHHEGMRNEIAVALSQAVLRADRAEAVLRALEESDAAADAAWSVFDEHHDITCEWEWGCACGFSPEAEDEATAHLEVNRHIQREQVRRMREAVA